MSQYSRLFSGENDTSEDVLIEKKGTACNSSRIVILALSLLVVALTVAVFYLIRLPQNCSSDIQEDIGYRGEESKELQNGGILIGLISDMHLMVDPDKCAPNKGWKFGTFGCDSTPGLLNATLNSMVKKLTSTNQNIILMLGDAAQHPLTLTPDVNVTLTAIKAVYAQLKRHFPQTPVFPTIGNNDLPMHNVIPDASWYDTLLPIFESALRTGNRVALPDDFQYHFKEGGYYSAVYGKELTIIALHTNLFTSKVEDSLSQKDGASKQLDWLERVLEKTEGKAAIFGHHPPMLSLYAFIQYKEIKNHWRNVFLEDFLRICRKYHLKILGIFAGHEHQDSFGVQRVQDVDIGAFSLPSISPVYQGQPAYCLATVSRDLKLLDIHTYSTWLDFFNRLNEVPKFSSHTSYSSIMGLSEINSTGMLLRANNIIRESDGMETFTALNNKVHQGRSAWSITPHLYFCYSTNILVANFTNCIEKFGYDSKMFTVNVNNAQ